MADPTVYGVPAATAAASLTSGDATNAKTIYTAPSNGGGAVLGRLRATSSSTSNVILQFLSGLSGVDYIIGEVQVPANSGTDGSTAYVDVLASLNAGNPLTLAPGEILKVKARAAMTSGTLSLRGELAPLV